MRKFFAISLAGLAILAFAAAPIFAGENCAKAGDSKACAKVCGAKGTSASAEKSGCPGATGASGEAKMIGAEGSVDCKHLSKEECAKLCAEGSVDCKHLSKEECAKLCAEGKCKYMTKEECAKLCANGSACEIVSMSIKGMTCGGCEQSITAALQKIDGVKKVVSVSYKDGSALVLVDPAKVKSEMLATAVTDKGYEAQIVPAVATMTAAPEKGKVCSPENKAACAKKTEKTGIEGTK